jgi:hypothetical protein
MIAAARSGDDPLGRYTAAGCMSGRQRRRRAAQSFLDRFVDDVRAQDMLDRLSPGHA